MQNKKDYWDYLIDTSEYQLISLKKQYTEIKTKILKEARQLHKTYITPSYMINKVKGIERNIKIMNIISKIKTKNDALLYAKHNNDLIRYKAEKILKGKI
jgi:hypothetical protein